MILKTKIVYPKIIIQVTETKVINSKIFGLLHVVYVRFPKDLVLSKFKILGCKIEDVASWSLRISTLILSTSLSNVLFSSCCWVTCYINIFIMVKISLLDIWMGVSWDPSDPVFPLLTIGEVFLLEASDIFFCPGGLLRGGGWFFEEIGGIEKISLIA